MGKVAAPKCPRCDSDNVEATTADGDTVDVTRGQAWNDGRLMIYYGGTPHGEILAFTCSVCGLESKDPRSFFADWEQYRPAELRA